MRRILFPLAAVALSFGCDGTLDSTSSGESRGSTEAGTADPGKADAAPAGGGPPLVWHSPTQPALQVSVGQAFTCALLIDKTVRCWGTNDYQQLGDGQGARHAHRDRLNRRIAITQFA